MYASLVIAMCQTVLQKFPCYYWLDRSLPLPVIDVFQWRASVDAFRAVQCNSTALHKGEHVLLARRRPMGFFIAIWLLALLLLAGDIEENPGPPKITRK